LQQERGYSALNLAIDDGVVDGGGTTVLGQEGGMQVDRAVGRHTPNRLGQHAKSNHDLEVRLQRHQFSEKVRATQLLWLQIRYTLGKRICVYGRLWYLPATTGRFVGGGNYRHDIFARGKQRGKRSDGNLGRTHEDDAHVVIS